MPDYDAMTSEELWLAVAERVMGWTYVGQDNSNDPDVDDEPSHHSHVFVDDCPPGLKIFRGPTEDRRQWNPEIDLGACMEALEQMRQDGWAISWSADNTSHRVDLHHPATGKNGDAIGDNFMRAACIAMLNATESRG